MVNANLSPGLTVVMFLFAILAFVSAYLKFDIIAALFAVGAVAPMLGLTAILVVGIFKE